MAKDLFSLTIFFVVFREALESSIIVSVLLGLVEQILHHNPDQSTTTTTTQSPDAPPETVPITPRIIKKLRLQVFLGALVGLATAIAVGAAFIAIWFTQAQNLWMKAEQLWEGIFEIIAAIMIFVMGVGMLKLEHARAKWRIKLYNAFSKQHQDSGARASKYVLFFLPMITILREGLEAVVFVGGVALGEPGTSIPIATIVGIIGGIVCGFVVYHFASRTAFRIFIICMANLLFLIGAGLFSRAIWAFQENAFLKLIGASSDEASGTGPGSYDVRGNVWHLECCNASSGSSWSIFNAVLGWQNSATLGSVLSYVFYWLAVIAALVYYKFREGRTTIFGWESAKGKQRRLRHEARETEGSLEKESRLETTGVGLPYGSAASDPNSSSSNHAVPV